MLSVAQNKMQSIACIHGVDYFRKKGMGKRHNGKIGLTKPGKSL